MKNKNERFQFTSEAEKLLNEYLAEIQNALTIRHASPRERKEIIEEVREHILQAYWKEVGSKSVKVEPLHEILETMGNPGEIASEYLVDRRNPSQTAIHSLTKAKSPSSKENLQETPVKVSDNIIYLILILFAVFCINLVLIGTFSDLKDQWVFFIAISDIFLLIPLIWFQFRWKRAESLEKWKITTPRVMQGYFAVGICFLALGSIVLPLLRGRARPYQYDAINNALTLDGFVVNNESGSDYVEFFIRPEFIVLASLIQVFLVLLFLLATLKAPIQWKQADVQMVLLAVTLPTHIEDSGIIKIRTKNHNPIMFPQVQMEILDQSPGFQTIIEPSNRTAFGQGDTVNWLIRFTPKIAGNIIFGRIVLRLGDSLTVSSPRYSLLVQERAKLSRYRRAPSPSEDAHDSAQSLDLASGCGICRQPCAPTDRVASCSRCGSLFHLSHLQEWLKGHNTCPNCSRQIEVSPLDTTYGTLVIERLEHLENELHRLRTFLDDSKQSGSSAEILVKDPQGLESFEESH